MYLRPGQPWGWTEMKKGSVLLSALLISACQSGDTDQTVGRSGEGGRIFEAVSFDTLWSVGGPADSSFALLWSPRSVPGGGLYVADIGNAKLHYVNAAGELVWSYGRRGQGPGELLEVRVFDVDAQGNAVIIDNLNRRIVTVGRDGNLLSEYPLPNDVGHTSAVAALAGGNLAVAHWGGPWALVSRDGGSLDPIEPPGEGFTDRPFLELVGQAIPVRGSNRWMYSFDTAGEWIAFGGRKVAERYPHIEDLPFSEVVVTETEQGSITRYGEDATHTTLDLAVREDTLLVLFFGATENKGKVVDKYNVNTGDYLGSVLLPGGSRGIAVGDDGTLFTVSDTQLFPTVTALRYK